MLACKTISLVPPLLSYLKILASAAESDKFFVTSVAVILGVLLSNTSCMSGLSAAVVVSITYLDPVPTPGLTLLIDNMSPTDVPCQLALLVSIIISDWPTSNLE